MMPSRKPKKKPRKKPKTMWKPDRHRFQALPVLFLRAREASVQNVRPVFREHGLTEQRWRVLRAIYDTDTLSASELAEEVFLSMTSISRITKQLGADKLIARSSDRSDRRSIRFSITQKGRELCSIVGPALEKRHRDTLRELDSIDIDEVEKTLNALIEELGGLAIPGG